MVVANTLDMRLTETHDFAHAIDVSQPLIMRMRTWFKMQHAESTHYIDVSQDTWWETWWPLRHSFYFRDDVTPTGQW